MDMHIYHGGSREFPHDKKIILTSYGVMKKESEAVFANINFDILVLDEVQHLKNILSLGAFSARKINADFRICLTGTPVENDLSEFYNILGITIFFPTAYKKETSLKYNTLSTITHCAEYSLSFSPNAELNLADSISTDFYHCQSTIVQSKHQFLYKYSYNTSFLT
jgi:superfamily II DNA or RNA helicase